MILALVLTLALAFPVHASWVSSAVDQRVVFTSNAALAFADSDWSIAAWLLVADNAGTALNSFIATNTTTGSNPNFMLNCFEASHATSAGKLRGDFNDDDTTDKAVTSSSTPCNTTGTWMHVLVKRESNALSLWVNGSNVDTDGADAAIDTHAAADWYFFLRPDLANDITGQLCDFGKWNRALTADEITALSQGFSVSSFLRGLEVWAPAIGEYQERVVPLTVTNTSTTLGKCPRIYYPY